MSNIKSKLNWINVSNDLLNILNDKVNEHRLDKVKIDLFLTPMYAPQSILPFGIFNNNNKKILEKFVIRFKYLVTTEENNRTDEIDENFRFHIGKISGKIYRIEIDVKAIKKQKHSLKTPILQIEKTINEALVSLAQRDSKIEPERPIYISKLFNQHKQDIFSILKTNDMQNSNDAALNH